MYDLDLSKIEDCIQTMDKYKYSKLLKRNPGFIDLKNYFRSFGLYCLGYLLLREIPAFTGNPGRSCSVEIRQKDSKWVFDLKGYLIKNEETIRLDEEIIFDTLVDAIIYYWEIYISNSPSNLLGLVMEERGKKVRRLLNSRDEAWQLWLNGLDSYDTTSALRDPLLF